MTPYNLDLAVQILAETDILWTPVRHDHHNGVAASAVWERRNTYRRTGLPLVGGGAAAERQAHSRQLDELRKAGVVQISGRGKARGVRLSDGADNATRIRTGGWPTWEAWPLLVAVAALGPKGGPVLEHDLAPGGRDGGWTASNLFRLEQQALPFLARGWLISNSDLCQRVAYFVTDEGRKALERGCPEPPPPALPLPEYDAEASDQYDEIFKFGLTARDGWEPEKRTLWIPMSAGHWPLPILTPEAQAALADLRKLDCCEVPQ